MGTLRLWAIGIDEVRGIFGAEPTTAERLRQVARERFGVAGPPSPGLLGRLGPFLRGGGDPAAPRPGVPSLAEVEDLLAGRFVAPHRLAPAWNLLELWFSTLAFGQGEWPLTEAELNDFDFDLTRAQVSARYGISDLLKAGLGISLTRSPGLAAGWVSGQHAEAMRQVWPTGLSELSPRHHDLATGIVGFLSGYPQWTVEAAAAGRPAPDLIAIFHT